MSVVIERASSTDAATLLAYLKQIGSETDNLSFGEEGLPFTVEAEAAYLGRIEASHDDVFLLAKIDGKIVGSASLSRLPRRMGHRGDMSISVLKTYWNQGIGRQLLRVLIDLAKQYGFEIVELQVRSDNAAAIHLYENFGFQKAGVHPYFFKIKGEAVSVDYMILNIR